MLFRSFTSIVSNYYYGETNLHFIYKSRTLIVIYRLCVGAMVLIGAVSPLDFVWALADLSMGLMTLVNIVAILILGKYAMILLKDYDSQRTRGYNPQYHTSTIPQIASETPCWPK